VEEEVVKSLLVKEIVVVVLEDVEVLKEVHLHQEEAILVEEDQINVLLIDQTDLKEVLVEKEDLQVVLVENEEIHKVI
jgi:hypothetical protein